MPGSTPGAAAHPRFAVRASSGIGPSSSSSSSDDGEPAFAAKKRPLMENSASGSDSDGNEGDISSDSDYGSRPGRVRPGSLRGKMSRSSKVISQKSRKSWPSSPSSSSDEESSAEIESFPVSPEDVTGVSATNSETPSGNGRATCSNSGSDSSESNDDGGVHPEVILLSELEVGNSRDGTSDCPANGSHDFDVRQEGEQAQPDVDEGSAENLWLDKDDPLSPGNMAVLDNFFADGDVPSYGSWTVAKTSRDLNLELLKSTREGTSVEMQVMQPVARRFLADFNITAKHGLMRAQARSSRWPFKELVDEMTEARDVHYKGMNGYWLRKSSVPCSDQKYAKLPSLLPGNPVQSLASAVKKATVEVECEEKTEKAVHLQNGLIMRVSDFERVRTATVSAVGSGTTFAEAFGFVRDGLWPGDSKYTIVSLKTLKFHEVRVAAAVGLIKLIHDTEVATLKKGNRYLRSGKVGVKKLADDFLNFCQLRLMAEMDEWAKAAAGSKELEN